jgi:hypothetical protein
VLAIRPDRLVTVVARRAYAPSVGSLGDACDNGMREIFFATPERELLDRRGFRTQAEARVALFDSSKASTTHAADIPSIGYLSPIDFERQLATNPDAHQHAIVLAAAKDKPYGRLMQGRP